MTVLGSAYVDIRAITDKLAGDIRSAIESINDSITLRVDADVSSATEKLDSLAESSLDDQTLIVDADTSSANAALLDIANTAFLNQTVVIDADTLAARSQFDDMLDDMDGASPTITPDVNTILAEARLAILTRARDIRIAIKMNSGALGKTANIIARMAGARVIAADIGKMVRHLANIDKAVPGIAKAATLIASIGGAAISSLGGLSTLTASLTSIISMVAIAAPGIAVGFVVGIGTLMVALKDFSKQLPEVTALYKTLGATIKGNYWDVARESIRDMTTTLFPQFESGLARTASALGGWSATFADAMKVHLEGGVLTRWFGFLAESIDIAKGGLDLFTHAMVELGDAGAAQLPRFASWWLDVSNKFSNFIIDASSNGDLDRWIERGILNLKLLGGVIVETAGIFSGITEAARMAGSDGLATLLSFVTRVNDAINSPEGMKQLSTIFEGANAVASALGDTFFKVTGAIGSAAPAIKSSFESVAGTVSVIGDALASIISDPAFQAGFTAMFDGIQKGFDALMPVVGTMGPKFGAFLSIIGSLAANIGGVLGAALEVVLPLVTAFKEAVDPLIPILGDALIRIIQSLSPLFLVLADTMVSLGPVIQVVVGFVADLVAGFAEGLGPSLPAIVGAIASLVIGFKAFTAATAAVKGITATVQLFTLMTSQMNLAKVATTLLGGGMRALGAAMLANPIGLIVGAVAALVAGFVLAYNNIGWFKDGVDDAVKWIVEAFDGFLAWWNSNIVPMWEGAMKGAGEFFGGIGKWVGEALTNIQNFFGGFGQGAGEAQAAVGGFFEGIGGAIADFVGGVGEWFSGIGQGIADAFNGAVEFVTPVIEFIGSILAQGVENMITNWTNAFNLIRDIFVNVWNGLVWFFQPIVDLIAAIIKGGLDIMVAVWTGIWDIVAAVFQGIWHNLVLFFTPIIQVIVDTVTNAATWISTTWNAAWQAVSDFFASIWNGIVAFVTPVVQLVVDTITGIVNGLVATWNAVWAGISSFFIGIWNGIVAFVSPIIQTIHAVISTVIAAIAAGWNATWSAISSFFSGIWSGITGFVGGAINTVRAVILGVTLAIQSGWNSTWSSMSGFISGVWSGIVSAVSGFVSSVRQNVQNALDAIGRIGADILRNVGNFGSLLISAGRDLINGLTSGITANAGAVVETIKGIAAGALDAVKSFFGIKSPSTVMRDQVGKQLGAGLAIGIEASIGAVLKATDKLAEAAVPDIADIMLPALKTAAVPSQRGITSSVSPALSRGTVLGDPFNERRASSASYGSSDATPVVVNVMPSVGMSEEEIGRAAVRELNWQMISR